MKLKTNDIKYLGKISKKEQNSNYLFFNQLKFIFFTQNNSTRV